MYISRKKKWQVLTALSLLALSTTNSYSEPRHQGWIDFYGGSGFQADISAVCPPKRIGVDFYGVGIHACGASDMSSIGWGWVCPKDRPKEYQPAVYSCNPNLDASLYANCEGGDVMVGVSEGHSYGSNADEPELDRCFSKPPNPPTLELSGPATVLPDGVQGSNIAAFIARVANSKGAIPSTTLTFTVAVIANSGGHEHHDVARPKGSLNIVNGNTDANGEVKFTFKAPEVSGIHTITVTCNTCANQTASKDIQVKVPDLLPISPNPPQNTDESYVYALTSVDKTHGGNGRYHHNQYYLTDVSRKNLRSLIDSFSAEGWGTVALNDASLIWGGRYDISSNWSGPHAGHREGREIDISFSRAQNPISVSKQKTFYKKFCETKTVQVPFSILHHYVSNPHFHVYLEKQTACWKSEK